MKSRIRISILALAVAVSPAVAAAQTPRPDSGAIGGDIGVFVPKDERLDSGLNLEGFYEYYPSARTSVRLGVGWAHPKFSFNDEDGMRYFRVAGDIVYNWEGGTIHPFVGAGLGVYFLQETDNGESLGDSESKLGGTVFGGIELFTSNTLAVKAEARYHLIANPGAFNPDGLAVTIGLKKYF